MIDAVIGFSLRLQPRQIGRKAPGGHRFGIGNGDDAVDGDARTDIGPVKSLQQRLRQGQPRGFDQNMVRARHQRHQRLDRGDEIIGDGAADAAVGQFDDVFLGAVRQGAGAQNLAIHADIAEFVDDHRQPLALRVLQQVAHQRGFARAQKAGDHGDGDLYKFRHGKPPAAEYGRCSSCGNGRAARARAQDRPGQRQSG